jgi:hypothetical protein
MSENITGKESRGLSPAALLVAGAFFMEFLDGTVIATALPDMAKSFGVQAVDLNIGISAYLITLAVLIPASGWIADRFGARKVFALALAIFTLASVFCGLSTTVDQFVAMRVLQDGRRTHGTCRPPGCITYHTKTPAYYRYSHADLARTGRPDYRPAARRFYYQLCRLALDLFHQCPVGHRRHYSGAEDHSRPS